jgi:hypothetical protein
MLMVRFMVSDEVLMAYADGELDGPQAEAVELALSKDPEATIRLVAFLRSRRLARSAFGLYPSEGWAPGLPSRDRPPPKAAASAPSRLRSYAIPLAAAILGIVLGTSATLVTERSMVASPLAILGGHGADHALGSLASGETGEVGTVRLRPLATYRIEAGLLCRDAILEDDRSRVEIVTCRRKGTWQTRLALLRPRDDAAIEPSGGANLLDRYLEEKGAGAPLSASEEKVSLATMDER